MLGLVEVGIKRKLASYEPSERSNSDQRQSILDISMCKLQTSPLRRVEPSLRRSVLIFNTLKQIEHELLEEGVKINHMNTPSLLPTIQSEKFDLDPPPSAEDLAYQITEEQRMLSVRDSGSSMDTSSSLDTSGATAVSAPPPTPAIAVSNGSERPTNFMTFSECRTVVPSSDNQHKLFSITTGGVERDASFSSRPLSPSLPNPVVSSSGGVDIFGDIDLSLYDFDLFSPLTPQLKAAPLSAEELLHTFPNSSSCNDWTNLPSFSGQSCFKSEIFNEELDCIMQILACN